MTAEPIYINNAGRLSGAASNALAIQNGLRTLGVSIGDPGLSQVTVAAIDANDFSITFPSLAPTGVGTLPTYYPIQVVEGSGFPTADCPVFQPVSGDASTSTFTGYPAAVQVVETSKAFQIGPIPISPSSPAATANAIEQYFVLAADANTPTATAEGETPYAPVNIPGPYTGVPIVYPGTVPSVPNYPGTSQTVATSTVLPQVSVVPDPTPSDPTGLYHYTITFQNDWGTEIHPALYVYQATGGTGASVLAKPVAATIVKESSPEFLVNDPEPNNSSTPYPAEYDSTNPQVAMDATGDFVITWQEVVPNSTTDGLYTDILRGGFRRPRTSTCCRGRRRRSFPRPPLTSRSSGR